MRSFSSPLHANPAFLHLWAGETASQFGFQIGTIATSAIAINLLHASNNEIGFLSAAQTIAFLLIGLPAGAWVDRWRKRRVMITADIVRVIALASVPIAQLLGSLTLTHLMAVAALMGFATVFFDVAYQSYVPVIVGPRLVAGANGRLEASFQVARVGGPGLGGWLIGLTSAPAAYIVTSLTYALSAFFIWRIRDPEPAVEPPSDANLWHQIREGVDFIRGQRLLGPLFACISVSAFFSQGQMVLLPILVLRELEMTATALGILLSFGALGGIAAALVRSHVVLRLGEGRSIYLCYLIASVATLGLPLATRAGAWASTVIVAVNIISSFFLTIYNVTQMSLRQRLCPSHLLGRLNATFRFAVWGMMPLGSIACGLVAQAVGVTTALYIFIVGTIAAGIAMAFTPAARLSLGDTIDYPKDL
ncbi:MFS transporter [Schaalia vaccimaxillae]|uniref:MFS transporter n=1 Tax=Schaalia vaccimaxillae TaxID=183916 RepID=UPI0003B47AAD|nr:MFS transporter [Schaalia vaccimaxillae]